MDHIDDCLSPTCPEGVLRELAIVSFQLVNALLASQAKAYEDLFWSLHSKGVLGVLDYEAYTPSEMYVRKVYIYPLNEERGMHPQLKTLLASGIIFNCCTINNLFIKQSIFFIFSTFTASKTRQHSAGNRCFGEKCNVCLERVFGFHIT